MNSRRNTRSSLFLIELMISVLFFALGSTVCIQVFVKAYTINEDARRLSFASLQASSAASALKYTNGSAEAMKEYFPQITEDKNGLSVYYDKTFKECNKSDRFFSMHITQQKKDHTIYACIRITAPDRKNFVYSLDIHYPAMPELPSGKDDASERTGETL